MRVGVTLAFLPFFLEVVVVDLDSLTPVLQAFGFAPRVREPWLCDYLLSITARQERRIENMTNLRISCWRVVIRLKQVSK